MERAVGSVIFDASGLNNVSVGFYVRVRRTNMKPLERLTPAITVDTRTASTT